MLILKKLFDFLKRAFSSRGGQIVFLINLALMTYVFFARGGTFNTALHRTGDGVLYYIMMVTSFPVIIAAAIVVIPLDLIFSSHYVLNYLHSALLVAFWAIQWVCVGYGLEKLFRRYILKNKS